MPSVRINPKNDTHLSYGQAQQWLTEVRNARRLNSLPRSTSNQSAAAQPPVTSSDTTASSGFTPPSVDSSPSSSSTTDVNLETQTSPDHQRHIAGVQRSSINEAAAADNPPAPVFPPAQPEIQLSLDQQRILREVKQGRNVFFTGPAGTGKSVLLRKIIAWAKSRFECHEVAITASTGIAGLNIGGTTVHSFAGIGLGKEPKEKLAERVRISVRHSKRWRGTRILIIDEISMLDGLLLDKLEFIARDVRRSQKPFGGIQLVLTGDFFQLPPVPDQSHNHKMQSTFAFDALKWPVCVYRPMFLRQVFRQSDNTFVDILSAIRLGQIEPQHISILRGLQRPIHYSDGIEPTQLYPLKSQVEGCNNGRLAALPGPEFTYKSIDSAGYDVYGDPIAPESAQVLLDRMIATSTITVKLGAQVMLIQNIPPAGHLVNGSTGKVIDFLSVHEALQRGIAIAEIIERSPRDKKDPQYRTREEIIRDVTQSLQPERQATLRQINDNTFTNKQLWPLVHFTNGSELLCAPLSFTVEGFRGNTEAHRIQVPLILAWALSIHKSQGQTLSRVKVDLGHVFETGQAYVALSRATTMDGLEIENFDPSKITVNPRVIEWQRFWSAFGYDDELMDSEEAMRSFWDT